MQLGPKLKSTMFNFFTGKSEKTEEESAFVAETQLKPYNPDDLYQKQGDHSIYKEMVQDDQVSIALQLKKDLVLGSGWDIVAEEEDQTEIVDDITKALGQDPVKPLTSMLEEILSAYEFGFSLSEKVFQIREDGSLALKVLKTRDPDTWLIHSDKHGNVTEFEQQGVSENLKIDPKSLIHYINNNRFDNNYGVSDLRAAYQAYFTKKHITRFYAIFLEKAASPTPIARYDKSVSDEARTKIFNVIKKFQSRTAMAIPKEIEVEFLESKSNGEAFIKGINIFNTFIGRALFIPDLLGFTGSDTATGGSQALGREQVGMFLNHIRKRRQLLEDMVNKHLIEPIVHFNHGFIDNIPKFHLRPISDDDAMAFAKVFIEAVKGRLYKPNEEEINHFRALIKFPEGDVIGAEPEQEIGPDGLPINKAPDEQPDSNAEPDLEDAEKVEEPDDDLAKDKPKNFAFQVFAPTEGDFSNKVDFQVIENKMKSSVDGILQETKPLVDDIFQDLFDQIQKKKIVEKKDISRIDTIKIKKLKALQQTLKKNFAQIFKDGQIQGNNELFRSDFAQPLLTDEFLRILEDETFAYVGDYEFNVLKGARTAMIEAIKDGKPVSSVINILDEEGKAVSQSSIERFARTKTTEILNKGRLESFEKSGVVSGYQYSAILDDRTSEICAGLHGKKFKKGTEPVPPLHFNCRSVLIPITKFEEFEPDNKVGGTVDTKKGSVKIKNQDIDKFIDEKKGKGFSRG